MYVYVLYSPAPLPETDLYIYVYVQNVCTVPGMGPLFEECHSHMCSVVELATQPIFM
jgi:hypothetical protein